VRVDFGDGRGTNLGAITAATPTSHPYESSGIYTATATYTDSTGDTGVLTTQVTIGSLPVTLSASPNPATVNSPVTFTVSGLGSAQVDRYVFTFSDGETRPTSSPQTSKTFTTRGLKTIRVDVFGVGGGQIGTNTIVIDVQ
jgi:PKD repeat protein